MKTPSPQEAAKWADREAERLTNKNRGAQVSWNEATEFNKAALLEADKNGYERGREEILTERDEAIREVEKYRKDAISMEIRNLNQELAAEKRRAAAYREIAVKIAEENDYRLRVLGAGFFVDAEAQKLLADSGGEKDFKSQQKGDSPDGNVS